MGNLIIVTCLTGAVGLGAGGLVGTYIGGMSKKFNAILLSFTAGTMIALICFELLHEAMESGMSSFLVAFVTLFGAAFVTCLDYLVDKHSGHSHDFITCEDCDEEYEYDASHQHCVHDEAEEEEEFQLEHGAHPHSHAAHSHTAHLHAAHPHAGTEHHHHSDTEPITHHHKKTSHLQLLVAGVVMAIAVAIHNIPEGMSVGAVYAKNGIDESLLVLVVSILMHNIPEGMAIALPLFTSGMNRWKASGIAALSGVPTIFGAMAGYAIGDMGSLGLAVSLSFAAGTLLYVVFGEVLPQSINQYCSRKTAYAAITGLCAGMLIIGMHVH